MKLTFKTERQTGTWSTFFDPTHSIRLDGKEIGAIYHSSWKVAFMVYKTDEELDDGNPNCNWRWITLKGNHDSLNDAKKWVRDNFSELSSQFSFHKID